MQWKLRTRKPEEVSELITYLSRAVEYAREKKLKIDGIYDDSESCEDGRVQAEIRLSTRSLMHRFCAMEHWNASGVEQRDVENALKMLTEAKNLFNNHPFSHVLYGRSVYIATESSKAKFEVPKEYNHLVEAKFESWQDPHLNYASLRDIRKKRDIEMHLPPEWRS